MWIELSAGACAVTLAICALGWRSSVRRLAESEGERKALARTSLVLEEERRVLELVAKGASLREVLDALTHAIERMATDCFCTVLLLDEDSRRLLEGSGGSLPSEYMRAINGLEIGPEVGACGTAAFLNRCVIVEDIQTDPLWVNFKDLAGAAGLAACWSQPIRGAGERQRLDCSIEVAVLFAQALDLLPDRPPLILAEIALRHVRAARSRLAVVNYAVRPPARARATARCSRARAP